MANQSNRRPSAEGVPYRSKLKRIETSVGGATSLSEHVEIFRRGPAAWNAWRENNPEIRPDLNGLELRPEERQMGPKNRGPINLRQALLRGASLRSAKLPSADLSRADLRKADLRHARLGRAQLDAAKLSGARLDHADLAGVKARKVNLRGAGLRSANLAKAYLQAANLSKADLLHAKLTGADLTAANLQQARLDHADLADANLKDANLAGASLSHARNLTRAQLEAAKGNETTELPSHLAGTVSWSGAKRDSSAPGQDYRRASPPRPGLYPLPRGLHRQGSWAAGIILWTFVVIGIFLKQSSEAVPRLEAAAPILTEISLATTSSPTLEHALLSHAVMRDASAADAGHDLVARPATARPILVAALDKLPDAKGPAPATLHESPDIKTAMPLPADLLPEQSVPDQIATDVQPELRPPSALPPPKPARVAALKRITLRPVTKAVTVRLREVPQDGPIVEEPSNAPMTLIVSLQKQKLDVYRGTRLIETSKISSGMAGYETKTGVFSILEKRRHHRSNLYSNAPMPWMLRLTWSGTALHGGVVPGYPASHGCIRLPFSFAPKLFEIAARGMNVVVAEDRVAPEIVDHPVLPQPMPALAQPRVVLADVSPSAPVAERDATPLRILVTRRTDRDKIISLQYALSSLGHLPHQNFTGRVGTQTRAAIRAFQKANDLPGTGAFSDELAAAIYAAAGREAPPEGHLFVRRGYKRVFDMPVAFSDPDRPLGTHVLTHMPVPGRTGAKWLAVSLEGGDAAAALDRLDMPAEAHQRLAGILAPGSTFIIGDRSIDTAALPEGGDFIVLTKAAPAVADSLEGAKQARRSTTKRKGMRQARRSFDMGPRSFPRGLFSRW